MKLAEARIRCAEDAAGTSAGTTASNVAYIPVDVPAVHKELTKLSKKKKQWGIDILESGDSYTVVFENSLTITVARELWEDFKSKVFGSTNIIESSFVADLEGYLFEAYEDEVAVARNHLNNAVVSALNSPEIASQRHKIADIAKSSGDNNLNFAQTGECVFSEPVVSQQLNNFLAFVDRTYKNDLGSMQLLTTAFEQKQPLTALPLFKNFDNLVGNQVSGTFQGVPFVYSAQVDLNWVPSETLKIQNSQVEARLKANPMFKEQNGMFYPASEQGFPTNLSELLSKYIRGA